MLSTYLAVFVANLPRTMCDLRTRPASVLKVEGWLG